MTVIQNMHTFDHTQYKEKSYKLISLVNKLRDAGAQYSLDLPCMVVCGNQSAGKSSLLERLCGVKLPRAAGTCTKCPTEVRMYTAPPGTEGVTWCCQIKLRNDYNHNTGEQEINPREETFKVLTQDQKHQLPHYISAAQKALLNPSVQATVFAQLADSAAAADANGISSNGSDAPTSANGADAGDALPFTRNVIVLEITGAEVDPALVDLPGIIQTDQADGSQVKLVQGLVQDYISRKRSIIVATISCMDDIDNQKIVALAREADPGGLRTVGVLTKADRIELLTHHLWLPVLQSTKYKLNLGYFCVRNPSQEDIAKQMTEEQAAEQETRFFSEDQFFSSEQVPMFVKQRFGVDVLRRQLSKQLVELTQKELPEMQKTLDKTLAEIEAQLSSLPAALSADKAIELRMLLTRLSNSIKAAIHPPPSASGGSITFFQAADRKYKELKAAMLAARPRVQLDGPSLEVHDTGNAAAPCAPAAGGRLEPAAAAAAGEEDVNFWLVHPTQASEEDDRNTPNSGTPNVITMDEARKLAEEMRFKELPGYTPYGVLPVMVQRLKGCWDAAAVRCVREVADELQHLTHKVVKNHFGQFPRAESHIGNLLYEIQAGLADSTEQLVKEVMIMEKNHIWTQNDHYLTDSRKRFFDGLSARFYRQSLDNHSATGLTASDVNTAVRNASSILTALGLSADDLRQLVARKWCKADSDVDDADLLDKIAGVLAYFKVASKRVYDCVPMHIKHYLLDSYCDQLEKLPVQLVTATAGASGAAADAQQQLTDIRLEMGTPATSSTAVATVASSGTIQLPVTAEELMEEETSTAELRAHLQKQLAQLISVRQILKVF